MKRPWLWMLAGWLVVAAGVFGWKMLRRPPSDGRAELAPAVAAILDRGGRVRFDEKDPERLVAVDFTVAPVSDADLAVLKRLPDLRQLNLGGTRISDAGLSHLGGLKGLEELYLLAVPITDAGLEHLRGLTGLRQLDLSATRVTDAGLRHLEALTGLEHLYLVDTRVTREGVKQLQRALPDLNIHLTSF
jgi:hypothetical protein